MVQNSSNAKVEELAWQSTGLFHMPLLLSTARVPFSQPLVHTTQHEM